MFSDVQPAAMYGGDMPPEQATKILGHSPPFGNGLEGSGMNSTHFADPSTSNQQPQYAQT
jgi:hypothetical protein